MRTPVSKRILCCSIVLTFAGCGRLLDGDNRVDRITETGIRLGVFKLAGNENKSTVQIFEDTTVIHNEEFECNEFEETRELSK